MGVKIAKKEMKLGIRASSTCTLNFDDLRVPAANIIGGLGKGYKVNKEIALTLFTQSSLDRYRHSE